MSLPLEPHDLAVVVSPLTRAMQTACYLVEGLHRRLSSLSSPAASPAAASPSIPIMVHPGAAELGNIPENQALLISSSPLEPPSSPLRLFFISPLQLLAHSSSTPRLPLFIRGGPLLHCANANLCGTSPPSRVSILASCLRPGRSCAGHHPYNNPNNPKNNP